MIVPTPADSLKLDPHMSMPHRQSLSPVEYLQMERAAEVRHEFFAGEVFAMSGGTPRHSLIKTNLCGELRNRLRHHRCTAYDSDLRVKIETTGLYTYPDASVVCGPLEFDDEKRDTIVNPTVLAEVLSPSTESYDRGKKFDHYQRIASLREYLLVHEDQPRIERFFRADDGRWALTDVSGLDAQLFLPSLGIDISLAEIYDKVVFHEAE